MANETIKKKGWRNLKFLTVIVLCMSLLLTACTDQQIEDSVNIAIDILFEVLDDAETNVTEELSETIQSTEVTIESENSANIDGEMVVHFIDVGQADATLFIINGYVLLFDTATASRGDDLVKYLKNLAIERIDVLVLSHPHDDHMGGSSEIINNFEIGVIYGPDIFDIASLDTKQWFDNMVDAVDRIDAERNIDVPEDKQTSIWHFPRNENGEFAKFNLGDAVVEFYAPLEDEYSDYNDYSICATVSYGTVDILLTGDATVSVEKALMEQMYDLDVEIFQAGHHGSDTSNSKEFLEYISPECIVISCGVKNKYDHPTKSVIELYREMNIPVYRTDESGNIIMTTNGKDYSFNVSTGTYTSGAEYKAKGD